MWLVRAAIADSNGNGEASCRSKWCTRTYAPSMPMSSAAWARSMVCSRASAAVLVCEPPALRQCPNERKPIFFTPEQRRGRDALFQAAKRDGDVAGGWDRCRPGRTTAPGTPGPARPATVGDGGRRSDPADARPPSVGGRARRSRAAGGGGRAADRRRAAGWATPTAAVVRPVPASPGPGRTERSSHRSTPAATCRPSSAATSAVSTGWTRLPAANTPGRLVRRTVSTAGPFVPRIDLEPGRSGQFVVGDPVAGEDDGVAGHGAPPTGRRCARPRPPRHLLRRLLHRRLRAVRSHARPGWTWPAPFGPAAARPATARRRTPRWDARWSSARCGNPASRRVSTADQLTSSAPTTTARRPGPPSHVVARWTRFCSCPVVYTPCGRSPGTRRAARGRSRAPVARTTARAVTSSRPCGVVTRAAPAGVQDVTMASVRTTAPADAAAAASRRAYAGPLSTRCRSRRPYPRWSLWRGIPPASDSRSSTRTVPAPARLSTMAAVKPAGPAPTISTSGRSSVAA